LDEFFLPIYKRRYDYTAYIEYAESALAEIKQNSAKLRHCCWLPPASAVFVVVGVTVVNGVTAYWWRHCCYWRHCLLVASLLLLASLLIGGVTVVTGVTAY
jgi:hypothetical protein